MNLYLYNQIADKVDRPVGWCNVDSKYNRTESFTDSLSPTLYLGNCLDCQNMSVCWFQLSVSGSSHEQIVGQCGIMTYTSIEIS